MGTAVWHPQDCLAAPHSDQHRRFSCVSDYSSCVARPGRRERAISASYEASIPTTTEFVRDVTSGNIILNQDPGLLGHKNASAGLLPLPYQASQSAHGSFRMLAPKISPCRSGKIAGPHVSKYVTSPQHSNFSSYASDVHISRCPSVPMLDHAARTLKFFPECFPVHAVHLHERKPPRQDAKRFLNSGQGSCMAGSVAYAAGAGLSCQKLNFLANSHFSNVFNPVRPKWVDCTDQSIHCRKRMHPELSQVEVYLGRQCVKPPCKVLPGRQGESICTTSTVGRKRGVNKQLKRFASEKRQGRLEIPTLQRPCTKGLVGSHAAKCHSSKIEAKLTSSAPTASSLEGKILKGLRKQASLDAYTQGRMCVFKMGSSQVTLSRQVGGTKSASLHGQCHDSINATLELKEVNEGDRTTVIAGSVSQDQYDLHNVDVTRAFDDQLAVSNIMKPDTATGLEEISRSLNSDSDNDETWVSMMNDERWAGPSFFNSPSPSSLPVPSFTFKFSRTASTGAVPIRTADYGAHTISDNSLPEAKCTWDAAFATKDLRRMLNLDHASCDL